MARSSNPKLAKIYAASNDADRADAYDEWAAEYDRDVTEFGITLPYVAAAVFGRFIEIGSGPILDAGCGTGMNTAPLVPLGYGPFHGIDLSAGMLARAEEKNLYASLAQMALGKPLGFDDDAFAVVYAVGCLSVGHGPANSFDELMRVTKAGGHIIFSLHTHASALESEFHVYRQQLTEQNRWSLKFETAPFISMQNADASIQHSIYVYQVLE